MWVGCGVTRGESSGRRKRGLAVESHGKDERSSSARLVDRGVYSPQQLHHAGDDHFNSSCVPYGLPLSADNCFAPLKVLHVSGTILKFLISHFASDLNEVEVSKCSRETS